MSRNGRPNRPGPFLGLVTSRVVLDRIAVSAWRGAGRLPDRPIVLTFDDGYRTHLSNALPILRARRWPGVLNLEVANLKPAWGIRPAGVRELIRAGWEIGAHTLTHPDLTALDAARLEEEVAGSRAAIQRQFKVPVNFFCYPSGRYNQAVIAAVQRAGFLGATTTRYGLARPSELYTLARVRVNGSDGLSGFAAKMEAIQKTIPS